MKELLGRLWKDESGQGMAEYGLILALIAVAVMVTLGLLGTSIKNKFTDVKNQLDSATAG